MGRSVVIRSEYCIFSVSAARAPQAAKRPPRRRQQRTDQVIKRAGSMLKAAQPTGLNRPDPCFWNCWFIRTLADDFRLYGRQAIEEVRMTQPAAYMKICALLVPREMKVEHSSGVKDLTDEQLEQAIASIKAMLAARAARRRK